MNKKLGILWEKKTFIKTEQATYKTCVLFNEVYENQAVYDKEQNNRY